jgi:hypothetical protein
MGIDNWSAADWALEDEKSLIAEESLRVQWDIRTEVKAKLLEQAHKKRESDLRAKAMDEAEEEGRKFSAVSNIWKGVRLPALRNNKSGSAQRTEQPLAWVNAKALFTTIIWQALHRQRNDWKSASNARLTTSTQPFA